MDEVLSRPLPEDLDEAGAVDEVGGILDVDDILVFEELPGIPVADGPGRQGHDLLDEHIRGHSGSAETFGGIPGEQVHGDPRQGGVDIVERVVGPPEIARRVHGGREERLGPVPDGAVKLHHPLAMLLEEQEIEARGQPKVGFPLIEPGLAIIDPKFARVFLDILRFAEQDVHPAPVCFPSGHGALPPEMLAGIGHPAQVFGLELVLRGSRGGVPVFPEGLHEEVTLPVRPKLPENLPLRASHDINDFLVEPSLIAFRELRLVRGSAGQDNGQAEEGQRDDRKYFGAGPHVFHLDRDVYFHFHYTRGPLRIIILRTSHDATRHRIFHRSRDDRVSSALSSIF